MSRTLKILVVDPFDDLRALLAELLQDRGHDVRTVGTLAAAQPAVSAIVPDVVLVATELLDTERAADVLRSGFPPTSCVLGMSNSPIAHEHLGCDAVVCKPIDVDKTLRVVEQILA